MIVVDWLSGRVQRSTEEAEAQREAEREKAEQARTRERERKQGGAQEMFDEP
ncbi:hypothetical protein D3C78_1550820 [compost metagenome]